jgi:hypothetical protein
MLLSAGRAFGAVEVKVVRVRIRRVDLVSLVQVSEPSEEVVGCLLRFGGDKPFFLYVSFLSFASKWPGFLFIRMRPSLSEYK